MASNANTDVDKLITFGQMALEQGWYDKAREYFEQALALDASNREAMKGLARVNEILSRKADAATEPIEEPARRVEQKRRIPEKKREGQGRSLTQWFKRLSRRSRIAVLAGVPLLFLYLCARLTDIASPTPECREDEPTYKQVVASDESAKVVLYLNSPVGKQAPLETSDSPIAQGLIELIASAEKTIDLAIYGLRNQPMIFEALKEASSRGVVVRIVIDKDLYGVSYYSDTHLLEEHFEQVVSDHRVDLETAQMPVEGAPEPFWPPPKGFLGPPQCVGYSLTDGTAIIAVHASREPLEFQGDIMHNKFAIVDGRAVWTGSCNLSDAGTGGYNANAAVIVHSDAVASWYSEEFERMFVSELFHRRKVGKVPQSVRTLNMADGESLEVAFSPQDSVYWNLIRPMLRSSKKSIDIGVFFLTHKLITADLIDAHQRGVKVRVIIDATAAKDDYTKHEILRVAGIPVKVENWGGKMHMKCALIDGRTLITGSMNWTSAGEYNNDENTIVINSERIGRQFASLYESMWHSIPDRWLTDRPDPESFDSPASVADGIDNDFDNLVDLADPGCGKNPPPLLELPPFRVVPLTDGYDLIKGDISKDGQRIYYLPTDPYYRDIKITEASGEKWFPSVWEAQEAGWRHAQTQE